ncbi:hypothetical protein Calhy_2000 [Caldicellulosiruptor hydrothermalis 108]|uniref:Uncharacterized protein n=1 Tax=Caldicellulosiruptor hydrothermalis (strain DSM 18901 / VKM B-2411 / 108) TaxID=632292 RepID=E4QE91_CALH1|nr:hypothetical protein Calhy_2000 [Caldicellulosiruptor hydrothermalis 108]
MDSGPVSKQDWTAKSNCTLECGGVLIFLCFEENKGINTPFCK